MRFYTTVFEMLEEGLLDTPYSMTVARVVFELAQRDATDMTELGRGLRIDAGYLSRIATRLEADGLVTRHRSDTDAQRQVLALTARGRAVFSTLDDRSSAQVARRTILGDDRRIPRAVVLRAPEPGDYGWIVARHGAIYAAEYGWDETFEGLVAQIVADHVADHDATRERAWIAELDGDRVGCVFCVAKNEQTAQLRILLVEPAARGRGLRTRRRGTTPQLRPRPRGPVLVTRPVSSAAPPRSQSDLFEPTPSDRRGCVRAGHDDGVVEQVTDTPGGPSVRQRAATVGARP